MTTCHCRGLCQRTPVNLTVFPPMGTTVKHKTIWRGWNFGEPMTNPSGALIEASRGSPESAAVAVPIEGPAAASAAGLLHPILPTFQQGANGRTRRNCMRMHENADATACMRRLDSALLMKGADDFYPRPLSRVTPAPHPTRCRRDSTNFRAELSKSPVPSPSNTTIVRLALATRPQTLQLGCFGRGRRICRVARCAANSWLAHPGHADDPFSTRRTGSTGLSIVRSRERERWIFDRR